MFPDLPTGEKIRGRCEARKSNLPSFQMFRNISRGAPHNSLYSDGHSSWITGFLCGDASAAWRLLSARNCAAVASEQERGRHSPRARRREKVNTHGCKKNKSDLLNSEGSFLSRGRRKAKFRRRASLSGSLLERRNGKRDGNRSEGDGHRFQFEAAKRNKVWLRRAARGRSYLR